VSVELWGKKCPQKRGSQRGKKNLSSEGEEGSFEAVAKKTGQDSEGIPNAEKLSVQGRGKKEGVARRLEGSRGAGSGFTLASQATIKTKISKAVDQRPKTSDHKSFLNRRST